MKNYRNNKEFGGFTFRNEKILYYTVNGLTYNSDSFILFVAVISLLESAHHDVPFKADPLST